MVVSGLVVLVLAAVPFAAYEAGVRRLRAAGASWPVGRELAVLAGVTCMSFGATAPLGERFSGHVVEHLLLGLLGPGLVAAGSPLTLALRASRPPARRRLRAVLRSRPAEVLTHPAVAVALAMLGPWVVWLSPIDRYQRESAVAHAAVHVHLMAAGALFAVAVLGLDHTRWRRANAARLLAAAVALPLHALLGLVILSASTPFLNPDMAPEAGLDDQRLGAALLWVIGDGIATAAMLVVGVQWAQRERREDQRSRTWVGPAATAEVTPVPQQAPPRTG
jgi:cytochrome c oxidase assembly factor CtaG